MNLSLFDDLAAPVPEPPGPAQPLRSSRGRGRAQAGVQGAAHGVADAVADDVVHGGAKPEPNGSAAEGIRETPSSQPEISNSAEAPPSIDRPTVLHAPEVLHPALWRADQLGSGRQIATCSGFASLDAELPGGGWPHRALTELLLPHPGVGELRLLAPALAVVSRLDANGPAAAPALGGRCVMLFDPPADLYASALAQLGVDARQWLVVRGRAPHGRPAGAALRQGLLSQLLPQADVLWALEQALKSGHVGAVLAWLAAPLKADALRRLQLAAQAHDGPAFIFRELDARLRPSPAPLRLLLQSGGTDTLLLRVLKRRGPPLQRPLQLVLPPVLNAEPEERAQASRAALTQLQARRAAFARRRTSAAPAALQQLAAPVHGIGWPR